jgi:hypothetical protein
MCHLTNEISSFLEVHLSGILNSLSSHNLSLQNALGECFLVKLFLYSYEIFPFKIVP